MTRAVSSAEVERVVRRLERERRARLESEQIAERATSELYASVQSLQRSESELVATANLVTMLQLVAVAANEAATFEVAAGAALDAVCAHTGWPVGHLYVTDEPGHLAPCDVWHLSDADRCERFREITARSPFRSGEGLPGRVLATGGPIWIPDVTADPNFPRARVGFDIEVRAGFAFPVLVGTEVVGVLEFFAYEPAVPDEQLLSVMANVGGQLGRVVERVRANEALRASERRMREVIETANDAFVAIDAQGLVIEWNHQAEQHFGWRRDEVLGRQLTETIIPPLHREAHVRGIEHFLRSGAGPVLGRRVELEAMHRDGHQFPVELIPWAVPDGASFRFNAFIHDITERKAFEAQLEHHSLHDSLTALPNRALLLDRLKHALARAGRTGTRVAVLFVDLDRFKAVNDSLGHDAGDRVLLGVAERVPAALRPGDTLARLSGDEFVVLCEDVADEAAALELGERVRSRLEEPFIIGATEAYVSASVGIAVTAPRSIITAEEILADADLAMYRAKERGRGVCELFDETLRVRIVKRLTLERSLRDGIDAGELVAHYQPIVDLRQGEVLGLEALVRWAHPERGLLAPEEFIGLAEETSLIGRVGEWMLRSACHQMREWRESVAFPPAWVAVNLSVRELEQERLVDMVADALREHEMPPESLVLEITETTVMHDLQPVLRRLWRLREMGVGIAIDDFGTGYSSLDRLRRMPVGALKIDRSFIVDMETTAGGTALVAAIVAMSHSLGLSVVAEGVETAEQLHQLRRLGADSVQGYFLARPMAPEVLARIVLNTGRIPSAAATADDEVQSAADLQEDMTRIILRTLGGGDDAQRTTRSLLAELQHLIARVPVPS